MTKTLFDIQTEILPAVKMLRTSPEETLDRAFAKTKSSHDAVFVFGENQEFLGLVSPSYSLFRKRYPYTTKVKTCLISPPHATLHTSLPQIAEFMIATGIYTLPVFEGGTIQGVINARNMLKAACKDPTLLKEIVQATEPEQAVTAPQGTSLVKIYELLRQKKVSRVVLVGNMGRMAGIVSRRDIQFVLTKPSTRERTKTGAPGNFRTYAFGIEKESRLNVPVADFAQRNVLSADNRSGKEKIVRTLLDSDKNSIVLTDSENRPTGIISTRVILKALASLKPEIQIPITTSNRARLAKADVDFAVALVEHCARKLSKQSPIQRVEIVIQETKDPVGKPDEFEITIHILFSSGDFLIATAKKRDYQRAVREAIKRIERQRRET